MPTFGLPLNPPAIMALQTELAQQQQNTKDLVQLIVAHISMLAQCKNNPGHTTLNYQHLQGDER